MADLERIYVVPLRRAKHTPATRRTKRAVKELKVFIARHMKAKEEKVWIDEPVNELLWSRGIQKPPTRIRVKAVKFEDDGVVEVSLPESEAGRKHLTEEERKAAKDAKEAAKIEAAEEAVEGEVKAEGEAPEPKPAAGETPAEKPAAAAPETPAEPAKPAPTEEKKG